MRVTTNDDISIEGLRDNLIFLIASMRNRNNEIDILFSQFYDDFTCLF